MKKTAASFSLILLILFSACSSNRQEQNENTNDTNNPNGGTPPQTIQENRSEISAEVISVDVTEEGDFTITAKVKEVETVDSYPSMAVAGETYVFAPNYILDEEKNRLDNDRNRELDTLKELKAGDTLKASVFLTLPDNWYIYQPL